MSWLAYRSHPRITPWPATILDIARSCERNNSDLSVSGMLVYSNEFYLQLLEGRAETLDRLWNEIAQDDRHTIEWVARGDGAPALEGLPMGYFDADREHAEAKLTHVWRDRSAWNADRVEDLREMLVRIAREKYPSIFGPH